MAYTETTNVRKPRVLFLAFVDFGVAGEQFWIGSVTFGYGPTNALSAAHQLRRKITLGASIVETTPGDDSTRTLMAPATYGDLLHQAPSYEATPVLVGQGTIRNNGSLDDGLFQIRENSATDNTAEVTPMIVSTGVDGFWGYQPYRYTYKAENKDANGQTPQWNFYGILTNGTSSPIFVGRTSHAVTQETAVAFGAFFPNNADIQSGNDPTTFEVIADTDRATFAITKIRSCAVYNGSVVYGGYHSWSPAANVTTPGTTDLDDFSHWIVFAAPYGTDYSCFSVDVSSAIQIGDSNSEPVTKVVTNAVATDQMGIQGNLMIFTPRKVVYYTGIPPAPGDDVDVSFTSAGLGEVGCWAAETVVRTPYGVVFMGTDRMIYLAPTDSTGPPVPIGRAIQPALEKMTEAQTLRVCATYFDNHYMISFPGSKLSPVNDTEYWCDLRRLSLGQRDAGVRWVGPMTGRSIGAYAVGYPFGHRPVLMGASNRDGTINRLHQETVTSDPLTQYTNATLTNASSTEVPILCEATSNPWDFGNAHQDKLLRQVKVGVEVDDEVDFTIAVSAISVDTENGTLSTLVKSATDTITPTQGRAGTATFADPTFPENGWEVAKTDFDGRMRGRGFIIQFKEEPGSSSTKDPKVKLTDLALYVKPIGRK